LAIVAVFDILGFKEIVRSSSLAEIKRVGKTLDEIVSASVAIRLTAPVPNPYDVKGINAYMRRKPTKLCDHIRFSDTIVLWTDRETQEGLGRVLLSSAALMNSCILLGLPVRGAVTRGAFFVSKDKSNYLGEALVRGHELEVSQEWTGAIVDPIRFRGAKWTKLLKYFGEIGLLIRYQAPLRDGPVTWQHCIDWPRTIQLTKQGVRTKLTPRKNAGWSAKRKFDAAMKFYERSQTNLESESAAQGGG
jgi:hypothetical protein